MTAELWMTIAGMGVGGLLVLVGVAVGAEVARRAQAIVIEQDEQEEKKG